MSAQAIPAPVDATRGGLTAAEAAHRLIEFGANDIAPGSRRPGIFALLLRLVTDPMVMLLAVAGATYLALGDRFDAIIIAIALVPIVAVNTILEQRADNALVS